MKHHAVEPPKKLQDLEPEEREDQLLDEVLAEIKQKNDIPKEKVHSHAKQSNGTLQQMLSMPYAPPCMVFENQVSKPEKPIESHAIMSGSQNSINHKTIENVLEINRTRKEEDLLSKEQTIEDNNLKMVE